MTAQTLLDVGVRTVAYPFDWVFVDFQTVQHCIESKFKVFLDPKRITHVEPGVSTHSLYAFGNPVPMFNHHDLTDPDVLASFRRRAEGFMQALDTDSGRHVVLLYMVKEDEWTIDVELACKRFCEFMRSYAPYALVMVLVLCRTGHYHWELARPSVNSVVARVHYADIDNLAAVQAIIGQLTSVLGEPE